MATLRDVTERLETSAQLLEARTRLEVLDDRDRIARELHDSVIQRLFAAGLHLQLCQVAPLQQPGESVHEGQQGCITGRVAGGV